MPQFDQFSFLNQIFYFLFYFFAFYAIIIYLFLPTISYNLKFRKKKLYLDEKQKNKINFEKKNIYFFFNYSYKNFYTIFENFFFLKKNINNNTINKNIFFYKTLQKSLNNFLNQKFILNKII